MTTLKDFDAAFPNSTYRLIGKQYTPKDDSEFEHNLYQKSKAPIDDNKYLYKDICDIKENRVGWIIKEGYVLIDIDEMTEARLLFDILQTKNIKFSFMKTKHGGHFIFKNKKDIPQGSGLITSIGLSIDTRIAGKGYSVLPVNDKDREWGNITNDLDELPYFLVPIKKFKGKFNENFIGMSTGSGRNDSLLKHILNLIDYAPEITLEEKVESILIINSFLFKEPLSEEELSTTVLREDILNKETKEKKAYFCLEESIASKILEKYQLISTFNQQIYKYNGMYYETVSDIDIERLIHSEYSSALKEHNRKEVVKFLLLKSYVDGSEMNKNWNEIVFKNGIYNLSTKELLVHTPTKYNTVFINCNYHKDEKDVPFSKTIDNFFNDLSGKDLSKKELLYEIMGNCLIKRNVFSKFFICIGEGQTGKSTYLELISKLLGEENCASLSLENLDDKYLPSELFGKLVNLGDDLEYQRLRETATLKKLVTGQTFTVQQKYKNPFQLKNFAKLIFTTNRIPDILDRSSGLYRRLMIVDLNHKVEKPDYMLLEKLTDMDMEFLLWRSIEAVTKAMSRGSLTECESSVKLLEEYKLNQSSILCFLDENNYNKESMNGKSCKVIYDSYKTYCIDSGFKPLKQANFDSEICKEYKLNKRNTTAVGETQCRRYCNDF